jgi:hypothetical protein
LVVEVATFEGISLQKLFAFLVFSTSAVCPIHRILPHFTLKKLRVLKRIFGPKGEELAGGWRRLHNEELQYLYVSQKIIRMIKLGRLRWAGREGLDWDDLDQDRDQWRVVVNTVMNLRVP